ncbi:hypothetical protein [Streptomyces sp. NBC_01264]|uniref:hypothetical protein n=1 Tax=Streptomyces sp. NBC_01264 TaxID=2903804 RepID=UPI002B1E3135|nr:hypothetical protein [Streptomyces sp. NBC_01264]
MDAVGWLVSLLVRRELGRDQAEWGLAADEAEVQALLGLAKDCPTTTVVYESAL